MMEANLWRPCVRIRVSAPALLVTPRATTARGPQQDALAPVLVASYGSGHLCTKSFAAPLGSTSK